MRKKIATHNPSLASPLVHSPFSRLKVLKGLQTFPSPGRHDQPAPKTEAVKIDRRSEAQLFWEAMQDVRPIDRNRELVISPVRKARAGLGYVPEDESLCKLVRLVDHGEGFVVSDTPEYMEGRGYHVHRNLTQKLHRGDYSVRAHIDLHGLSVTAAREVFESFLTDAFRSGKRAVLIIHGRGLSSPGEPVLKNKIREWLGRKYWLRRIVAFTSAQSYDGGAGATYVLLRDRPVSRLPGKK